MNPSLTTSEAESKDFASAIGRNLAALIERGMIHFKGSRNFE